MKSAPRRNPIWHKLTKRSVPKGPRTFHERIFFVGLALGLACLSSLVGSWVSISVGIFATGHLGEQLQVALAENITTYLRAKMDPLRIYLQQGVNLWEEMGLNLSNWEDLQQTLPYQRAFLENYFDESRCCSGMFVNVNYDYNFDGVDDSLACHAIMSPSCTGSVTGSMEKELARQDLGGNALWAGVLHYSDTYTTGHYPGLENLNFTADEHSGDMVQVLPGNIEGGKNNTLSFRYYNHKRKLSPWRGDDAVDGDADAEGNEVLKIGFVHWPIQDGFWYRDIQKHDLQKHEVRFASRVFPWTLYPPAVLKSHIFTPLHDPDGNRIGGWVTGFKLHWISTFLEDVARSEEGTFVFIVERDTGVLITTSDPQVQVLKNYDTTASIKDVILAAECPDSRVSSTAQQVMQMTGASKDNWQAVNFTMSRPEITTKDVSAENFVITQDFAYLGLDWVIVLSIPSAAITKEIDESAVSRTTTILIVAGILSMLKVLARFGAVRWLYKMYPMKANSSTSTESATDDGFGIGTEFTCADDIVIDNVDDLKGSGAGGIDGALSHFTTGFI